MAKPSPPIRQAGNIWHLLVIRGVCRRSLPSACAHVKYRCRCRVIGCANFVYYMDVFWLFRSLGSACVHAAFSSTPCESALSSRASESTKRQQCFKLKMICSIVSRPFLPCHFVS